MSIQVRTVIIKAPILFHLQGKIFLRDNVGVMIAGINQNLPNQKGLNDFVYWHWAQLQFNNPDTQLVKIKNLSITPYVQAFLSGFLGLGDNTLSDNPHSFRRWQGGDVRRGGHGKGRHRRSNSKDVGQDSAGPEEGTLRGYEEV